GLDSAFKIAREAAQCGLNVLGSFDSVADPQDLQTALSRFTRNLKRAIQTIKSLKMVTRNLFEFHRSGNFRHFDMLEQKLFALIWQRRAHEQEARSRH